MNRNWFEPKSKPPPATLTILSLSKYMTTLSSDTWSCYYDENTVLSRQWYENLALHFKPLTSGYRNITRKILMAKSEPYCDNMFSIAENLYV